MRTCRSFVLFCGLLCVVAPHAGDADEEQKPTKNADPFLTVRLVDEQGKPVADARAGIWAVVRNFDDKTLGDWSFPVGDVSDANGLVRFRGGAETFKDRPIIIARHAGRHLMGIRHFADKNRSGIVEITLRPECHVQWRFASNQVQLAGRELGRLTGMANFEGSLCSMALMKGSTFHALLPPGKFTLQCHVSNATPVSQEIEIKPGQQTLDLGTSELKASQIVQLEGQPAPELDDVVEWKNGPPVKIAQLRGKYVLLEFWGLVVWPLCPARYPGVVQTSG